MIFVSINTSQMELVKVCDKNSVVIRGQKSIKIVAESLVTDSNGTFKDVK